jgi:hypothetical protein
MTDQEHAKAIIDARDSLQAALISARKDGLAVKFNAYDGDGHWKGQPFTVIDVSISREVTRD